MPDTNPASLSFRQAIDYFRNKVPLPSRTWRDIDRQQHDFAFVVAGATRTALVQDFYNAILQQLQDGVSFNDFQKDFDRIVERYGWDYRGSRDWRSQVIFDTNLRTAYAAGRNAQHAEPGVAKRLPYKMYRHSGKEHFRPLHKSWDGKVLRADDDWWKKHDPPQGFGCGCTTFFLSDRQLRDMGKFRADDAPDDGTYVAVDRSTGEKVTLPRGVDLGFNYSPGEAWIRSLTPPPLDKWKVSAPLPDVRLYDEFPAPKRLPASVLLPSTFTDEEYGRRFLQYFGADIGSPVAFEDVVGDTLMVSEYLLKSQDGYWKIRKRSDRAEYLLLAAEAIKNPDEVYALLQPSPTVAGKYELRRRYLAAFEVSGQTTPAIAVFEWGPSGWLGTTAFKADSMNYLMNQRVGVRLYRRKT